MTDDKYYTSTRQCKHNLFNFLLFTLLTSNLRIWKEIKRIGVRHKVSVSSTYPRVIMIRDKLGSLTIYNLSKLNNRTCHHIHLFIIKLACNNQLTWVDFMEWLGWVVLKHSSFYPAKIPINQARAAITHLVIVKVFLGDQINVESRRKPVIKSIVSK